MLDHLLTEDRRLAMANQRVRASASHYKILHERIDYYLQAYCRFNGLDATQVLAHYEHFARRYNQHQKQYQQSRLYPYQYEAAAKVDRVEYDIALILSCISSVPRFGILQQLQTWLASHQPQQLCVIGAGAGIELALMQTCLPRAQVSAYDPELNPFLRQYFPAVDFHEQLFDSRARQTFDTCLAIEVLEHLADPLAWLHQLHDAMPASSRLLCTTASHMPQFDHLYNFLDLPAFQQQLGAMGFVIEEHRELKSPAGFTGLPEQNDWFVLEKNR